MKCPLCFDRQHIHISSGSGYSQDIRECEICETVWSFLQNKLVVIFSKKQ